MLEALLHELSLHRPSIALNVTHFVRFTILQCTPVFCSRLTLPFVLARDSLLVFHSLNRRVPLVDASSTPSGAMSPPIPLSARVPLAAQSTLVERRPVCPRFCLAHVPSLCALQKPEAWLSDMPATNVLDSAQLESDTIL
jgi:hypothetical protein